MSEHTLAPSPLPPSTRAIALVPLLCVLAVTAPLGAQEACPDRASGPADSGWEALRHNDVAEARRRFEEALSRCPDHDSARTGLGYVHLREGVPETARVLFRSVLRENPENVDAHVGLGLLAWRSGDLGEVERRFDRVLELIPGDPTARRYLGRVEDARAGSGAGADEADRAWERGERDRSRRLYSARVAADSTDVRALHRLALLQAWRGRYEAALELMERLIDLRPSDVEARVNHARILAWRGDTDRALRRLEALLDDRPTELRALEATAEILTWFRERPSGGPTVAVSSEPRPRAGPEPAFLGRPPVDASRFRDAVAAFDSLVSARPDALEHRVGLGRALVYAGRYDSARVVLRDVLERSPGNLRAQEGLALALTWDGRLREGEEAWRSVVRTDPRSTDGWLGLAGNLRRQDRAGEAVAALNRARDEAPGDPRVEDRFRRLRAGLAPRVAAERADEDDAGRQGVVTDLVTAAWNPVPRLELRLQGHRTRADQPREGVDRTAQAALLTGAWEVGSGWSLSAAGGASESDGSRDPEQLRFHLRAASPPGATLAGAVRYDRDPLDRTAFQVEKSVSRERWAGLLRWRPTGAWSVSGEAGWSEYRGVVENGRWDVALGVDRRTSRWTIGAGARGFGFDRRADGAYFAPERYGLVELVVGWSGSMERWQLEVEVAPGVQAFGPGEEAAAAGRAGARLSYHAGPGRRIYLGGSWARNGLVDAATGEAGFDYRTLRIGGSWAVY